MSELEKTFDEWNRELDSMVYEIEDVKNDK